MCNRLICILAVFSFILLAGDKVCPAGEVTKGSFSVSSDKILLYQAVLIRGTIPWADKTPPKQCPITISIEGKALNDKRVGWRFVPSKKVIRVSTELSYDLIGKKFYFSKNGSYSLIVGLKIPQGSKIRKKLFSTIITVSPPVKNVPKETLRLFKDKFTVYVMFQIQVALYSQPSKVFNVQGIKNLEKIEKLSPTSIYGHYAKIGLAINRFEKLKRFPFGSVEEGRKLNNKLATPDPVLVIASRDLVLGRYSDLAKVYLAYSKGYAKKYAEASELLKGVVDDNSLPALSPASRLLQEILKHTTLTPKTASDGK